MNQVDRMNERNRQRNRWTVVRDGETKELLAYVPSGSSAQSTWQLENLLENLTEMAYES